MAPTKTASFYSGYLFSFLLCSRLSVKVGLTALIMKINKKFD